MAKDTTKTAGKTESEATKSGEGEGEATEKKRPSHIRMVTHPKGGHEVPRKDYILECAENGMSRSEIRDHIAEITNDPDFRYQIVFQATRELDPEKYPNLRGGHKKKAAAAKAEGEGEGQAEAADAGEGNAAA